MITRTRLYLGIFINLEISTMLLLNLLVLTCIMKGRLYARKNDTVYVFAIFNIICDSCMLALHLAYMGPGILLKSFLFDGPKSLGVTVLSVIFLWLWYQSSLIQILFAANRLFVICFPLSFNLTKRRSFMLIAFACLLATVFVTFSQLLSPCCRIIPNPLIYSYEYLRDTANSTNLSVLIVDIPLDMGTSFYCIISYSVLFIYIHRASSSENDQTCKRREMKCCMQFLLMFLTYTFVWLTLVLRTALDVPHEEIYSFTLISLVASCGVNSIIYLTMNVEVRGAANKILGKEIFSMRVTSNVIHFTHPQS